jgi:2-polyprenyl-3-methyl-5-hydroxy-6-metoxy-1,4-benzoquinol methylase
MMTIATKQTIPEKLRARAGALQSKIDEKQRPIAGNLTPKRNREYQQRMYDAGNLERTQLAMQALADAHDVGDVPPPLAKLLYASQISPLVRKKMLSNGYYHVGTGDYSITSEEARWLQSRINGRTPSLSASKIRQDIDHLERQCRLAKLPGFFPTPREFAARMVEMAGIENGQRVLEPSAGSGRLIEAIFDAAPGAVVTAVEQSHSLIEILEQMKFFHPFTLHLGDFLEYQNDGERFDAIVMNPPFEKAADAVHVIHALEEHLKPGGRLVAIVSSGTLTRSIGPAVALQFLIDGTSTVETIPSGSFEDTSISAAIIVLRKGGAA